MVRHATLQVNMDSDPVLQCKQCHMPLCGDFNVTGLLLVGVGCSRPVLNDNGPQVQTFTVCQSLAARAEATDQSRHSNPWRLPAVGD